MKTLFVLAAVCAALAFGSPLFAQSDAPPTSRNQSES